jgi:hypothetical protein
MARAFSANRNFRNPAGSNTNQSGVAQGTMGGRAMPGGGRPGRMSVNLGDEMYLWFLLLLEVGAIAFLRNHFRRYHGG